ncbi:MAG: AmmeMemoRadiSam system radical SAM enzyme [Candidatus Rifleibacteriota bacterium]
MGEGETGLCLSRGVRGGNLLLFNYAKIVAANLDPIEKKPLYHFFPGRPILSIGSYGCNLRCKFCQNSDISQFEQPSQILSPESLVQKAFEIEGNIGVAFTYNEPGIWYEYICDSAKLLKDANLKTVLVTNGYLCHEPFKKLCKVADAMNIDLKAFQNDFYRDECGGDLENVKRNIILAYEAGVHIEITNLVITSLNDDENKFREMVDWLAALSTEIPLHISRYFPRYLETAPATPPATIHNFVLIAREKLQFVYAGNVTGYQNTYCPKCNELLIERSGYATRVHKVDKCSCGFGLPFVL